MNIREYNKALGVSNTDERRILKVRFPRYDRATHSMITHPEDYGVELTDEAQDLLISVFGPGPGLGQNPRRRISIRKECNRRCPYRFSFRLDEETATAFTRLMKDRGFRTVQDFLSSIVIDLVKKGVPDD